MGSDVFISFAFKNEEVASRIHSGLINNGVNCVWCKDLSAGDLYGPALSKAIRESKILLLLISSASEVSDSVYQEVMIAHNNKIKKMPVRLENIITQKFEYAIAGNLYFDFFDKPFEQAQKLLLIDVKKHLTEPVSTQAIPPVKVNTDIAATDVVSDNKWHDMEFKFLSPWVHDRINILTSGKILVGKTFIYRLNKITGKYQRKLK